MKIQIENALKELKWDKKKNKMIDKDQKKRLLMIEDFILNLFTRASEVFKFCETSSQGFVYILPSVTEKDQHSEAYQKTLLCLEGIYQFTEYMLSVKTKEENRQLQDQLAEELSTCKQDLTTTLEQLKLALNEKEAAKKQTKDIIKHTQMIHEKCKLKKLHYKEVIRENEHLIARNKIIENELKGRDLKIEALTAKLDTSRRYIEKTQKDLKVFKDKVHKMTIEINLLEKINIEQAIDDEDGKKQLINAENLILNLQKHDPELYEHLAKCDTEGNCEYIEKRKNINDASFKYQAAKNLIKRMQITLKKKSNELQQKANEIVRLQKEVSESTNKICDCTKNEIIDSDGIIEENRRLWDGYFHLQLEHVSIEKDIELAENKYQSMRDRLNEVNDEKRRLNEENKTHQQEIVKHINVINNLKEKHEQLEVKLKEFDGSFGKLNCDKEQSDSELSHLKRYFDQQQNALKENELKFISLENEYLHAQELLQEYRRSFEKVEELLDTKTVEFEEKLSNLTAELAQERNQNDVLTNILESPLVSRVVDAYIKMGELEECIENMMNLRKCKLSSNIKKNNNYIEHNNTIYENGNKESQTDKNILYKELKYKIKDLRGKCEDSIDKVVRNANSKLGKYKMTLVNEEDDNVEMEDLLPSTFKTIKLQLHLAST